MKVPFAFRCAAGSSKYTNWTAGGIPPPPAISGFAPTTEITTFCAMTRRRTCGHWTVFAPLANGQNGSSGVAGPQSHATFRLSRCFTSIAMHPKFISLSTESHYSQRRNRARIRVAATLLAATAAILLAALFAEVPGASADKHKKGKSTEGTVSLDKKFKGKLPITQ